MKIAYIGNSQYTSLRIAELYVRTYPEYEHTYVLCPLWHNDPIYPLKYKLPYDNVNYILFDDYRRENYDLVINVNDKYFDERIKHQKLDLKNLADKSVLSNTLIRFGKFDTIKNFGFTEKDWVIMKPIRSSGSYSQNPLCYKKLRYEQVIPFKDDHEYIIQEYIESINTVSLHICIGSEFHLCDIRQQEFIPFEPLGNKHLFAFADNIEVLSSVEIDLINKTKDFFEFTGYNQLKGFYFLQFIKLGNTYYLNDFNTRMNPVNTEGFLNNLIDSPSVKMLPYVLGLKSIEECLSDISNFRFKAYTCYQGKPITSRVSDISPNAIKISRPEESAVFQNLIDVYYELC